VGADAPAVSVNEDAKAGRWRVVGAAGLFVLGFTVVFAAGTASLFGLIDALALNGRMLQRIGGVVTIALALVFLGMVPAMQRTVKFAHRPRAGVVGAPLLGAVFALGWTPCIGPTLSGVLSLTAGTTVGNGALRGLLLMVLYCLGLGVPFLLIALGARWAVRVTTWLRAHVRGVQLAGGGLLLVVGVLLVSGLWSEVVGWLRDFAVTNETTPI
jgi:cytochrome c-type biogenesis protein